MLDYYWWNHFILSCFIHSVHCASDSWCHVRGLSCLLVQNLTVDGKTLSDVSGWSQVGKCWNDRVESSAKELVWVEGDSLKLLRENDSLYNHTENDCDTQGHRLPSSLPFLIYWSSIGYLKLCIRVPTDWGGNGPQNTTALSLNTLWPEETLMLSWGK